MRQIEYTYEIEVKDYLGKSLKEGDKCVRASKHGNSPELERCSIISIDLMREYGDYIEVLGYSNYTGEQNSKTGWTYPRRLIKI